MPQGYTKPEPNHLSENLSHCHTNLRNKRFMATDMSDINTGEIAYWIIMAKEKGCGHHWKLLGNDKAPYCYYDENLAKADAKRLCKWAEEENNNHGQAA